MAVNMDQLFFDLKRARFILAVAKEGSISAAARALNIAQPALSYHIAEMERILGSPLFERTSTGVVLTIAGRAYVENGKAVLEAAGAAEITFRRQLEDVRGNAFVRLAVIPSLASAMLPRFIEAFRVAMPEKSLRISDARTLFAQELIKGGKVDAAITLRASPKVDAQPLTWESLFCVTHASAESDRISFRDFAQLPLILPARENPLRQFLESEAAKLAVSLNVIMDLDGFEPRRRVVSSGYGATVLGAWSVSPEMLAPNLFARKIVEPELTHPIMLEMRPGLDLKLGENIRRILKGVFSK